MWEVVEFKWGCGVRNLETGKWTNAIFKPEGTDVSLESHNVDISEWGIEFLGSSKKILIN